MSRKNISGGSQRHLGGGSTSASSASTTRVGGIAIQHPKTKQDFERINRELNGRGYIAIDMLKKGDVRNISLAVADAAQAGAQDMAGVLGSGSVSNGPLASVAWNFYGNNDPIVKPTSKDGKPLGDGYVKWGAADNIPSVIPPLAMSSPYTAAPLQYLADLAGGLGARLMYRLGPDNLMEYKDAGEALRQRVDGLESQEQTFTEDVVPNVMLVQNSQPRKDSPALQRARQELQDWENSYYGYDICDNPNEPNKDLRTYTHIPGAKEFVEENDIDLHLSQCMIDNMMLNIYFPTVGLQRGRSRRWDYPEKPRITRIGFLPCHSTRLGVMDGNRHIHNVYFSDSLRTKGAIGTRVEVVGVSTDNTFKMYPCAMPQHLLSEIRYLVSSNAKTRIKERPTWIVCPTFYPSGQKPYYPQCTWWSVFTSKAFDFSATILYDKYKQRENNTSWGRIIYISLDYLDQVFADEGYKGNPEKQQEFIDNLDSNVEEFLKHRENNGKMMRQFMWLGADGKEHHNIEVVDVKDASSDTVKAGKDELELSTSPIFLALQVDPRLVGVPMVAASNGGTALREMQLLKQQMLSIHQRGYCRFLNAVADYNGWAKAEWHIKQQTLTTLDNSKTGTVETISGENA